MPTEAVLEPARARYAVLDQRLAPVVPLLDQRFAHAEPVTLDRGASIRAHAHLREAGDLSCQFICLLAGAALRGEVFAQADVEALLRRHFSSGENDLECSTLADDPGQPHGSAVDQRHSPTAAI